MCISTSPQATASCAARACRGASRISSQASKIETFANIKKAGRETGLFYSPARAVDQDERTAGIIVPEMAAMVAAQLMVFVDEPEAAILAPITIDEPAIIAIIKSVISAGDLQRRRLGM